MRSHKWLVVNGVLYVVSGNLFENKGVNESIGICSKTFRDASSDLKPKDLHFRQNTSDIVLPTNE